jgi:mannose-6-phosphate isomerase
VRTALSIQAHPNKTLAEQLHKDFPDKYKDPNHKPEIAIGLSEDFKACYGFLQPEGIIKNLEENPALKDAFPLSLGDGAVNEKYLKGMVEKLFLYFDKDENQEERINLINAIS